MNYFLATIAIAVVLYVVRKAIRFRSLYPLLPRRFNFGKRRITLRETLRLLEQRSSQTLVETGVARNGLKHCKADGASTIVFAKWLERNTGYLYSVDINPDATNTAKRALDELGLSSFVNLAVSDSVAYLKEFSKPVDFLYLDSYDYDKRDQSIQKASQQHHLDEFIAIESRLHDNTVVLIDDCDLPGGGKGRTVIDYMLSRGWKIHLKAYQVLLVRS